LPPSPPHSGQTGNSSSAVAVREEGRLGAICWLQRDCVLAPRRQSLSWSARYMASVSVQQITRRDQQQQQQRQSRLDHLRRHSAGGPLGKWIGDGGTDRSHARPLTALTHFSGRHPFAIEVSPRVEQPLTVSYYFQIKSMPRNKQPNVSFTFEFK